MDGYRYHRGGPDTRESIDFDIMDGDAYETTCVVDVDLLLCGIRQFPCGNGDDRRLAPEEVVKVLEAALEGRKALTSAAVKTMDGWHASGLNFDEYCKPGDEVSEDIVEYFINVLPPITLWATLVQAGEPHSHEPTSGPFGLLAPTYTTFRKQDGHWHYRGACFKGQSDNKDYDIGQSLEKALQEARKEAERRGV